MASGPQHLVDKTPGCWQVSQNPQPHCWPCPGAPTPPFSAAALVLPSPQDQKAHVGLGCWKPSGDGVVQDPKKPLILDLKTSVAGAVQAWEQVRGPTNPSPPKVGLSWPGASISFFLLHFPIFGCSSITRSAFHPQWVIQQGRPFPPLHGAHSGRAGMGTVGLCPHRQGTDRGPLGSLAFQAPRQQSPWDPPSSHCLTTPAPCGSPSQALPARHSQADPPRQTLPTSPAPSPHPRAPPHHPL